MDTHRLEVFCKVVELKSFTRAARALSLSQPTVSDHIRVLEALVGEKLLERVRGDVQLTPVGRVFSQYAKKMVQLREEALAAVRRFKAELAGDLVMGASTIPGTYLLPKLIASFGVTHPHCRIELKISDTQSAVEAVAEGALEAGIVGAKSSNRKVAFEELVQDELILVAGPDHRWAKKGRIDPADLPQEPFVVREVGSGTLWVMSQILEEKGVNPSDLRISARMDTTESVRQCVKAGIGVSILSRRAVEDDLNSGSLSEVEIAGIKFPRALYLVTHRNRQQSPVCAAFLDHVRNRVGAPANP